MVDFKEIKDMPPKERMVELERLASEIEKERNNAKAQLKARLIEELEANRIEDKLVETETIANVVQQVQTVSVTYAPKRQLDEKSPYNTESDDKEVFYGV